MDSYTLVSIGTLTVKDSCRFILLDEKYIRGQKQMEFFSHLRVFWRNESNGCGSSFSILGDNYIKLSSVEVLNVLPGRIEIASDNIPENASILDIKAYMPMEDRVRDCKTPAIQEKTIKNTGKALGTYVNSDFEILSIGIIKQKGKRTFICLEKDHIQYLQKIKGFSHLNMIWYFNRLDGNNFRKMLVGNPPYEAPKTGVFASRSPVRPNPLALSVCSVLNINYEKGEVEISAVDAFNKTPVIGLIGYCKELDFVENFRVPEWLSHWPEYFSEGGADCGVNQLKDSDLHMLKYFSSPVGNSEKKVLEMGLVSGGKEDAIGDRANISILGARQNNLKDIDISIPLGKMTVVTGVSGSGKSSIAFDTVFAEGQRRFMQSLTSLARFSAGVLEKPDFDNAYNLLPAVAIEQKRLANNPRSTIGSISDVYSYLRLLFARLGRRFCTKCGMELLPQSAESLADKLTQLVSGTELKLYSGKMVESSSPLYTITIDEESSQNTESYVSLRQKIAECYNSGNGFLTLVMNDGNQICVTEREACPSCDAIYFKLTPSVFSYNSPSGLCETCNGMGRKLEVDPDKVITNPELSLLNGASPWYGDLRKHMNKPNANWFRSEVLALADSMKVDLETPWNKLPEEFKQKALYGSGDIEFTFTYNSGKTGRSGTIKRPIGGAINHLKRLFNNSSASNSHEVYKHFLTESDCPDCEGERLSSMGRFITLAGKRYPEAASMTICEVLDWLNDLPAKLAENSLAVSKNIINDLKNLLQSMLDSGLYYLSLDRPGYYTIRRRSTTH